MYPTDLIKSFADLQGWKIHVVNRKITASINSRKEISEWLVMNY